MAAQPARLCRDRAALRRITSPSNKTTTATGLLGFFSGPYSSSASPLPGPLPPGSVGPSPATSAAATASPRQR